MGEFINFLQSNLADFWTYTGFYNATYQHFIMIAVGIFRTASRHLRTGFSP